MPVTLAQAKLQVQDALQMGVIDEFAKSNFLFNNLIFDDCVSPTGGGTTLTYAYTRQITQPTAAFRAINSEYAPQNVEIDRFTVDLKPFGGAFEIDRVLADVGGVVDRVTYEIQQKAKAASALFNNTVINGDSAVDANAFDGLDKALTGSDTEFIPGSVINLSTTAAVDANSAAFLDQLDEFLMGLDDAPTAIMGNTKMIAKVRAVARRAAMYQITKDSFGRQVEMYGVTPLVDLGAKEGSNAPVVPIDADEGTTSLYAVRLGLDGFHAVSKRGVPPVESWLPDFDTAGAVKKGEAEMVAAVALRATKAAGVMRNIKVA